MKKKVTVVNPSGMHVRPAGQLVKAAHPFKSTIEIEFKEKVVNVKSIIGIMSLGIAKGDEITVSAVGEDEKEAVDAIVVLIESGFGEI